MLIDNVYFQKILNPGSILTPFHLADELGLLSAPLLQVRPQIPTVLVPSAAIRADEIASLET